MNLLIFLLVAVAEEDFHQVVMLGFGLCSDQPGVCVKGFSEGAGKWDYMVGLTWVISAEFFGFVLLFAHKLCIWRNFSP